MCSPRDAFITPIALFPFLPTIGRFSSRRDESLTRSVLDGLGTILLPVPDLLFSVFCFVVFSPYGCRLLVWSLGSFVNGFVPVSALDSVYFPALYFFIRIPHYLLIIFF